MKEEIQLKIIELMDDGATLESSSELKALVESSVQATKFYEGILVSESMLESFFGGEKAKAIDSKIDALVEEQLAKPQMVSKFSFKPAVGFAIAASLAFIALTFMDLPINTAVNKIYFQRSSVARAGRRTNDVVEPARTPLLVLLLVSYSGYEGRCSMEARDCKSAVPRAVLPPLRRNTRTPHALITSQKTI